MATLVRKVCAESCRQADKVRRRSRNQHNGGLILCSDDLIAYRDLMGTDPLLPMGLRRVDNRHEDHAQGHAEE